MVSVALFYTAITLTIPEISLATNVVSSSVCQKIQCSTSSQCPPWHYCDTNQRVCQPCTRCIDGSDAAMRRGNCRDPTFCIDSLYARQDYDTACPRLGIADGYNGSVECKPCGGALGNYLGTTCRANCTDGDWEVFSCIFLNEVAQWNVSRKPYWIVYETFSPPPPPSTTPATTPATTPPTTPPTTPTTLPLPSQPPPPTVSSAVSQIEAVSAYHLEALAGIVAGTVLGVSVIVFLAIMLVVCMRRRKNSNVSKGSEQPAMEHLLPEPADSAPSTPSGKIPVESVDPSSLFDHPVRLPVQLGSSMTICSRSSLPSAHPQPTEDSDYNPSYSGRQPPSLLYESLVKNHRRRRSLPSSSLSLFSLRSDRIPVQPQEHSPPLLVAPPPAAGSSDSGHPPCRYSSSNSLHQETMRKSVMDLAGEEVRRQPIEQSQETSSGYPPRDSCQDLCISYYE